MIIAGLVTTAALLAGGGAAYAASHDDTPAATATRAPAVSQRQAEKIALAKVPGKVTSSELETEHGRLVWEIHLKGADGRRHEVKVDAAKGTVVKQETSDDRPGRHGSSGKHGGHDD